jgi:hypothetical protein
MAASELIRRKAVEAAERRLGQAATFAEMHCSARPLFMKRLKRPGSSAVVIRFDWPGVLRVYDAATGEVLAESETGNPGRLRGGR